MAKMYYYNIDSAFDLDNELDRMIAYFDPDIKEKTINTIREVIMEAFKLGLEVGQLPVNKKL